MQKAKTEVILIKNLQFVIEMCRIKKFEKETHTNFSRKLDEGKCFTNLRARLNLD